MQFKVAQKLDKMGFRGSTTAELVFDECRVPAENLVGEENRGLSGGVLNMTGGVSSTFTIYLAGATRNTIGFDGLLIWMMGVSILCATALGLTAYAKFDEERV